MTRTDIRIFDDIISLAEEFCSEFVSELKFLNGDKINIALSGGNTPKVIFQTLTSFKEKPEWKKIHLFWGDERSVPPENPESNFKMSKESLLDHIDIPSENINRIKGESDPFKEAERYADVIIKKLNKVNNLPSFEIIILGLGEDGHTTSIFFDQMELLTSEKTCEVALHPVTKQKRITVTGKIINNSKKIYFLVSGKKKASIVNKILNKKNNYLTFPASHINPVSGELIWFLDKEAASEIK
jgi:6-phosphogluconolactonase